MGANVLVARFHGAGRDDEVNETVHTAITLSMISGIFLLILGVTVTRTLLIWMGSPDDVLQILSYPILWSQLLYHPLLHSCYQIPDQT